MCKDNRNTKIILDEYGREYTGKQFLRMLESNCPISIMDKIGREFE
jgi:hypothetical protein